MTEVNIPLLRKAVEWAEAEAAKQIGLCEWEQGQYVADREAQEYWRSSFANSGKEPSVANWTGRLALKAPECGTCYCIAGYVASISDSLGDLGDLHIHALAQELLGLGEDAADQLFDEDNTINDVRRIAEEIAGESL